MLLTASFSAFITLAVLSVVNADSINSQGDLHIGNQVISPDGFERSAVLAGGTFPGPLITGKKGGRFQINVIDELTDTTMSTSTSIHWHGLFQKGTNWADGPSFVTQCPIIPGNSFDYDFSVPDQAGTFWYHSHLGTQYCDGLRGPLVIYDLNDPHKDLYDVDDESTVITVGDWYHVPSPAIQGIPVPDSTLINGKGRYAGGPLAPLTIVGVESGKRYRFRIINVACDPNYQFSIDGHTMTIIEADGENTKSLEVDSLQIFAGQRYSFILNANQPVDNYWIRANPDTGTPGFTNGMNSAILRYRGAPTVDPIINGPPGVNPLKETNLQPLTDPAAPGRPEIGGADILLNLAFGLNPNPPPGLFTVNGASFLPPTVPVLLQILSGNHDAHDLLPAGSVYTLQPNKVVELSMPAGVVGGPHPFHLHGHSFSVVRSAGSSTYNYVNPVRRDVVNIGDTGDNVTVRFVTDNAGPWFLHCHIDWHLNAGLAIVFAENPDETRVRDPVPDSWSQLCPLYESIQPDKSR